MTIVAKRRLLTLLAFVPLFLLIVLGGLASTQYLDGFGGNSLRAYSGAMLHKWSMVLGIIIAIRIISPNWITGILLGISLMGVPILVFENISSDINLRSGLNCFVAILYGAVSIILGVNVMLKSFRERNES